MRAPSIESLRRNLAASIGLLIFVVLLIAMASGHYILNPFMFGATYYVLYVLVKYTDSKGDLYLVNDRLLVVSAIALLTLFSAFSREVQQDKFLRRFQETCYYSSYARNQATRLLCEEIQLHIDNTIDRRDFYGDDQHSDGSG